MIYTGNNKIIGFKQNTKQRKHILDCKRNYYVWLEPANWRAKTTFQKRKLLWQKCDILEGKQQKPIKSWQYAQHQPKQQKQESISFMTEIIFIVVKQNLKTTHSRKMTHNQR